MASADLKVALPRDWAPGNPWFWMGIGLVGTILTWAWLVLLGDVVEPLRLTLLALSLLSAGGAVSMRLQSSRPAFVEGLSPAVRDLCLTLLSLIYAGLASTLTLLLVLRIFSTVAVPWKPGSLVVVWFLVVPVSASAAWKMWRRREPGKTVTPAEEGSALLVLGALALFLACRGLYFGADRAGEWDTMRLLLAVLAFVALAAAPLLVVPQDVRRGAISLLILLHFGGICTAVLSAPPIPWIISQVWTRIYRPYLEFMYLNNAYHFYSPEPGPASYLWFRLQYADKEGEIQGEWYKIPEFDERGRPKYPVALIYQRVLALTENTVAAGAPVPNFDVVQDKDGKFRMRYADYYERRMKHMPDFKPLVGEDLATNRFVAPLHPYIPLAQQYMVPAPSVKQLLESCARHIARRPHSEHPEYELHSVKIYRVMHLVPYRGYFMNGVDPRDPEFYRPYFVGEFDPEGNPVNLDDKGKATLLKDPFLYWVLPIVRDYSHADQRKGGVVLIRDYARKHAGDPRWILRRPAQSHLIGSGDEEWSAGE